MPKINITKLIKSALSRNIRPGIFQDIREDDGEKELFEFALISAISLLPRSSAKEIYKKKPTGEDTIIDFEFKIDGHDANLGLILQRLNSNFNTRMQKKIDDIVEEKLADIFEKINNVGEEFVSASMRAVSNALVPDDSFRNLAKKLIGIITGLEQQLYQANDRPDDSYRPFVNQAIRILELDDEDIRVRGHKK